MAAVLVAQLDRRTVVVGHPPISPGQEGHDHRIQVESLLGQAVLEAVGMIAVRAAGQYAVVDEQRVAGRRGSAAAHLSCAGSRRTDECA